ncbi:MAG: hypothetical protein ACLU0O_05690 [Collinsella sp.]
MVGWIAGPTVTTFAATWRGRAREQDFEPRGRIALSLAAQSVRIFAPIPAPRSWVSRFPTASARTSTWATCCPM